MSSQETKIVPHTPLQARLDENPAFFDRILATYIDACDFSLTEAKLALPSGSIQEMLAIDPDFSERFTNGLMVLCGKRVVLMLPAVINAISTTLVDSDADARTMMSAVSKHGELLLRLTGKGGKDPDKKPNDGLDDLYRELENR